MNCSPTLILCHAAVKAQVSEAVVYIDEHVACC